MHSAWVTSCSRMAARSCGSSAASSGKSRWQCESTNMPYEHFGRALLLHRVRGPRGGQRFAQDPFDRGAGGGARVVLRELHADALRAIALNTFGRDPHHLALDGEAVG